MAYAPWGKRALAYLIDAHLNLALLLVAYTAGVLLSGVTSTPVAVAAAVALYGSWLAVCVVYNRCIRIGRTGQSWGRQVLGISLVSEATGEPVGVGRAMAREFCHALDLLPVGMGFLLPLRDPKRRTIADRITRTVTIDVSPGQPVPAPEH